MRAQRATLPGMLCFPPLLFSDCIRPVNSRAIVTMLPSAL
jgi:hypothetical protein